MKQNGNLFDIVDQKLDSEFNRVEAERMIKVALLCTSVSPSLRPNMSDVVNMLEGTTAIPDLSPEANSYDQDLRFKTIREHYNQINSQSTGASEDYNSMSAKAAGSGSSSVSASYL